MKTVKKMTIEALLNVLAFAGYDVLADANPAEIIDTLKGDLLEINEQVGIIQAKADGEKRDLTEDEESQINAHFAEFSRVEKEITRRETMQAQASKLIESYGPTAEPQLPSAQIVAQGGEPGERRRPVIVSGEDRGKWGWKHFGDFAAAVRIAQQPGGMQSADPRLIRAAAPGTAANEGAGADGGFAVPPDFRAAIMEKVNGSESLIARTDQMVTSGNAMTFPSDESTPWDATNPTVATVAEGNAYGQSKIVLDTTTISLSKLGCLVPVTEELLEDAPSLNSYLGRKVPTKFDFMIQDGIINGNTQFAGIVGHAASVNVAEDASQTADTVTIGNVVNMWARMYAPCRSNAVWLINQDIEPQLMQLKIGDTAAYLPAGGLSGAPYGMLLGRPVLCLPACQTLGTSGDIILADLSSYLTVMKAGGLRQDVSVHLFFDADAVAFKFTLRVKGQPWWKAPITPPNSALTQSCFVTLEDRTGA